MFAVLGGIGIGAVIGWLVGTLETPGWNTQQFMAFAGAMVLVLLEVNWLAGWQAAVGAFSGVLVSFLIHRLWRNELRNRS